MSGRLRKCPEILLHTIFWGLKQPGPWERYNSARVMPTGIGGGMSVLPTLRADGLLKIISYWLLKRRRLFLLRGLLGRNFPHPEKRPQRQYGIKQAPRLISLSAKTAKEEPPPAPRPFQ